MRQTIYFPIGTIKNKYRALNVVLNKIVHAWCNMSSHNHMILHIFYFEDLILLIFMVCFLLHITYRNIVLELIVRLAKVYGLDKKHPLPILMFMGAIKQ